MIDTDLLGYWSDDGRRSGAAEANDMAFRDDGSGFTYWARIVGGTFTVERFTWLVDAGGRLQIRFNELLYGNWVVENGQIVHRVENTSPATDIPREFQITTYSVTSGTSMFGKRITSLKLDVLIHLGAQVYYYKHNDVDTTYGVFDPRRDIR
ncbi:hypothetical protein G1H11_13835 [Phytoactinopolyspora alkaliphila]|uniref:Uncharacterized protein n=1 Tax=Phytoactinopolyspora alkaliphila TaxID=1783498 RepID=A0A6N9YN62_9ACTN|nr:hypothetical protein [Phytoactinopolyspora alkaliphila]NED96387.1 hypothetical protein [Phytoactinopolyspora alkaliphila]